MPGRRKGQHGLSRLPGAQRGCSPHCRGLSPLSLVGDASAVPSLPWRVVGSAGPLAFPAGAWGPEQGWGGSCISMKRLGLLFLLESGVGWGTAKGPKKSHSGPMRRGPSRPPPSKDAFFVMGWTFNGPVSPLCLALPSAFCRSLAPFLSLSVLPLPSAPDLPRNFPMEGSPKGRGGKELWQ